jgi:hypothetical protein
MNGFGQGLAVIGALVGLATVAGALWAVARSATQDTRIKFLEAQVNDYLSRLNYIEPKLTTAEEQNRILLELHNPAEQIKALAVQEQSNHDRTLTILTEQKQTLAQIESKMPRSAP